VPQFCVDVNSAINHFHFPCSVLFIQFGFGGETRL